MAEHPQHRHRDDGEHEVGHVRRRGHHVVPAHRSLPEVILQHGVGVVSEEHRAVDVAHRLHLQRIRPDLEQPEDLKAVVGGAACLLVGEPHHDVEGTIDQQDAPGAPAAPDEGADQEDGHADGHRDAVDGQALQAQPEQVGQQVTEHQPQSHRLEVVDRNHRTQRQARRRRHEGGCLGGRHGRQRYRSFTSGSWHLCDHAHQFVSRTRTHSTR